MARQLRVSGRRPACTGIVSRRPPWLQSLPCEVLGPILHNAGYPTRLVCRHFRDSYGPLHGGLRLDHISARRDLLALAPAAPARPPFSQIHTLALTLPRAPTAALLSALPPAFPALHTLHLTTPGILPPTYFSALAPLNPTLTHLSLTTDAPGIHSLGQALPSLSSLHLHHREWVNYNDTLKALAAVGSRLTRLRGLHVDTQQAYLDGRCLARLARGLPHLTRIAVDGYLEDVHDSETADALASAWPQLADVDLLFFGFDDMPPDVPAALVQRPTLTRLAIEARHIPADLDLLRTVPLRELCVKQHFREAPQRWSALAADMSTVTKLALLGAGFVLDAELAGRLAQLSDSLLSLELQVLLPSRGHLAHLSCLSRLQDLTLERIGTCEAVQHTVSEGQASSWLAAGLSSLRCLRIRHLGERQVARPLVAGLGVHSALRELQVGMWDPRWPVRLQAVADTLARLTICRGNTYYRGRDEELLLLLFSLRGLGRLHYLHVTDLWDQDEADNTDDPRGEYGAAQPDWVEGSDPPANRPLPPELDATQWPEWGDLEARAFGGACGGQGALPCSWLPPRLRVLVVEQLAELGEELQRVLRAAARQQGCVVRQREVLREWDNCAGYAEGASLEWLRAHGQL